MPRAIWSGTISFGLVSVPVRMLAAVSEHKLHFNLLHRKDESPIGYEKCQLEEKPVPDGEIVKAYEIEKGEFVYVEDEDFQAARAEGGHAFDIEQFVPVEDIDPIYFEHSYYLGPQDGAEKVYMLRVEAIPDEGLASTRPRSGDHAASCDDARTSTPGRGDGCADRQMRPWRRCGQARLHAALEIEAGEEPDLMEALRASLDAHAKKPAPRRKAPARRKSSSSTRRPTRRSSARR